MTDVSTDTIADPAATLDPAAPKPATWKEIAEAGGIQPWVLKELRRRNLLDEGVDPSRLSKAKKKEYKARREEERRVKRLLKKHGYPPDQRQEAVDTVIEQAEQVCREWGEAA